jgi:hypothetical protein
LNALQLIDHFDRVRPSGHHRWVARCPAHEDRHPSLGISELPDGRVLIHCFAGCAATDILAAINLTFSDLFPHRLGHDLTPGRRPFDAMQALIGTAHEVFVVAVIAGDLTQGLALNEATHQRLRLAEIRVTSALASIGELPPSAELRRIRRMEVPK